MFVQRELCYFLHFLIEAERTTILYKWCWKSREPQSRGKPFEFVSLAIQVTVIQLTTSPTASFFLSFQRPKQEIWLVSIFNWEFKEKILVFTNFLNFKWFRWAVIIRHSGRSEGESIQTAKRIRVRNSRLPKPSFSLAPPSSKFFTYRHSSRLHGNPLVFLEASS